MKKIIYFLILLMPIGVFALSNDYKDVAASTLNVEVEKDKVNLYLFYGEECPHCEEEREWLEGIKDKYSDSLNIYEFEVWHNNDNVLLAKSVASALETQVSSVPFTVIGESYFTGFSETTSTQIENKLNEYIDNSESSIVKIPLLGKVDLKSVSIPLVAVILGFVDGFNPCAMWILLFLINMLFGMNNKKKAWFLGITFLLISALVYFLSMLGINLVLSVTQIQSLKIIIALFILVTGILNFRKYLKTRKEEDGCTIVDDKKRKKIITRMRKIMDSNSFILALFGIIVLATSVNLIELACSLGFPLIFTETLSLNNITGFLRIIYLLIYIFFYMIDDMFVFTVSMFTLNATGVTNKYNKLCTLVSAIIMIIMGILLLFKSDWLMLNF